jgi:hypothetical protein
MVANLLCLPMRREKTIIIKTNRKPEGAERSIGFKEFALLDEESRTEQ